MEKDTPRLIKPKTSFTLVNIYDGIVDTIEEIWLVHEDTIKTILT